MEIKFSGENAQYVKTKENLLYKVVSCEINHDELNATINLALVAGFVECGEHFNIMNHDGWFYAGCFTDDIQDVSVTWYYLCEGINDALSENDFEPIGNFDCLDESVKKIIFECNGGEKE